MAGFKNLQALRHFVDGRPAMTERKDDRLWGGRFAGEPDAQFDRFQRSFAFDRRLLAYEIAVDRAWAKALEPIGIFTAAEVRQTLAALDKIAERAKTDPAWIDSFGAKAEDVHHFVEKALVEELGPLGWKLHTGRSRAVRVETAHGPQPQRTHRHGFSPVCDGCRQGNRTLPRKPLEYVSDAGQSESGCAHGRHDTPAACAANTAFALFACPRGGIRPRPDTPGARGNQRGCLPHGFWRARREFFLDPPQRHRQGAGVFPHHFTQPGCRKRSRFCARLSFRAGWDFDAPVPPRRRLCPLCVAGILLRDASRRIFHGQQPDATEKEPGLLGTDSRENRPHQRGARRLAHDAQRSAYGLSRSEE